VTVRLDRERWEKLRETAEEHTGGDVAEYVTRVIEADVEDHQKVLGE
jgi:predicted DNA-binding protein